MSTIAGFDEYHLETTLNEPGFVCHTPSTGRNSRIFREERWAIQRDLGQGAFGEVRLETTTDGSGRARAVKVIRKIGDNVHREIAALTEFSRSSVGRVDLMIRASQADTPLIALVDELYSLRSILWLV